MALSGSRRGLAAAAVFAVFGSGAAGAAEPIKIGFGMGLTGGLAGGKSALLAMKIWEEEINAKGGLLGRPVKLIYYDDQSNPATVPGIYTKLLDVDKVDIVIGLRHQHGGAGDADRHSAQNGVLWPVRHGVNRSSNTRNISQCCRPAPWIRRSPSRRGFSKWRRHRTPKPKTLAIVAADAEFPHTAAIGGAQKRQGGRPADRLRQDLPAGDDRLHADRARG